MNSLSDPPVDEAPAKAVKSRGSRKLRHAAEARIPGPVTGFPAADGRSPEQLVHELQGHQIELEMQNEALREAQHALEESRDRYADLYDFSPVGYLTLTRSAIITEANLTAATLLGVERKALIQGRIRKFIADSSLDRWDQYFRSVLHSNAKRVSTLDMKRADGSGICARLEGILFGRDGAEPVVRIAVSDITGRVRAEGRLARKSRELDELGAAYKTIAEGQEAQRKMIAELSAREGELKEALAEKDVLLSEIHHRVKNNLTAIISLLSIEGEDGGTPAGHALKTDLRNRARSMALVHETLYQTKKYSEVDMGVYLCSLVAQVAESFPGSDRLGITVAAEGVTLDIGRATPCGLIVNELLTNSFKYAFPGDWCREAGHAPCTVAVSMTRDGDRYRLSVSDNGIGIPETIEPKTAHTLGLKLVSFLARHQLRATVDVRRDRGTEVVIRFGTKQEELRQ
ncbi:MAG TPA: histidine kinase dimerization/phosphoacceptor domain -containing protein [Methanoregula sp.]|nr:histidine kinase dimerization/phosphoacceptor domain -containing protein [Methanoregula sp.]